MITFNCCAYYFLNSYNDNTLCFTLSPPIDQPQNSPVADLDDGCLLKYRIWHKSSIQFWLQSRIIINVNSFMRNAELFGFI